MKRWIPLIIILCLAGVRAETENATGGQTEPPDVSTPYTIDPMQPAAGDFIDTDLQDLLKKAEAAYSSKNYTDAARFYLAYLQHDIKNAVAIYNLSCCYALLGDDVLAAKYLKRAVAAGFTDIQQIERDSDFDGVRSKPAVAGVISDVTKQIELRNKQAGTYRMFKASSFFPGHIHLPASFDKTKQYPLIVGLHGFGGDAVNFSGIWDRFEQKDFIYVTLRAPYSLPGKSGGFSWIPVDIPDNAIPEAEMESLQEASNILVEAYVLDSIEQIRKDYPVSSVYLMGFSQGAMQSLVIGLRHPKKIEGIVSIGGKLFAEALSPAEMKGAKKIRILIAHGKDDRIVNTDDGRTARDILTKNGNPVEYVEFDGGHIISEAALKAVSTFVKGQ